MTHFIVLIIVPYEIFVQGNKAIEDYISKKMEPYSEEKEVEPYILHTKDELEEQYSKETDKVKNKYPSFRDYCKTYCGYELDENFNATSTYNKDCFWDWYVIGGRWDGRLTGNIQYSDSGFNFDDRHHTITNNSIKASDLLEKFKNIKDKYIFYSVLNKNGEYLTAKSYGWFGYSENTKDKEEWNETYEELLKNNMNDFVVNLDCHI